MKRFDRPSLPKPAESKPNLPVGKNRSPKDRIRSYLHIHGHTFFSSLGRVFQNPQSSGMTIMVIAVALTLPSGFYLLIDNINKMSGVMEKRHYISIYLEQRISNESARKFTDKILQKPWVKIAEVITKEAGLQEFQKHSSFGDALSMLGFNPLPTVIRIEPEPAFSKLSELTNLVEEYRNMPEVDAVQIDLLWVQRLQSIMHLAKRIILVFSLLLAIAVIFIVSNTIRLELQNRKDEIIVAKLVGATNSFIQRPLIYSGFWYGLLSSVLALAFVQIILLMLEQPVNQVSLLYNGHINLRGFSFGEASVLTGISIILGITGAWLILCHQLGALKPE